MFLLEMAYSSGKTGILLVNLGTPDSPKTGDVRRYLRQFLLDPRVVDIPWLPRQLLVNGIIAPFRAPKSAKVYQEIWTDRGSPLMFHGEDLLDGLRKLMQPVAGQKFVIELAMRYQNPSVQAGLKSLREQGVDRYVIFPLFPQYASATTGSVHEEVMRVFSTWQNIPDVRFIQDYYDHPAFIRAFADAGKEFNLDDYDHILFSYHGLPERQIRKADDAGGCLQGDCCGNIGPHNRACYRAQCHGTTRALVKELELEAGRYSTCFQSRLGRDPWIQPYTSDVLEELAHKGTKKLLVFCPAFVADCIETIDEIGVEYAEEFQEAGGEQLDWVESLNSRDLWINGVKQILLESLNLASGSQASQA